MKETWQRVIFDQWVVGVDVENCDERYIATHLFCLLVDVENCGERYIATHLFCLLAQDTNFPDIKRKREEFVH